MFSGFVTSVVCKVIASKYVVRALVRHSQRMNDSFSEHLDNQDNFRKR